MRLGVQRELSLRVWLDPIALAARDLTTQEVETVLRRENTEFPAGRIESKDIDLTIKLDKAYNELENYKNAIKSITKKDFNLNSPKQLSEILYEDMKYPVLKKTPKGAPSTDASVLEELSKSHELPKLILKYREYEKLRSTYIEGLKNEVVKNRVHTSYNLFGTTTGRLS